LVVTKYRIKFIPPADRQLYNGKNGRYSQEKQTVSKEDSQHLPDQSTLRHITGHRDICAKTWLAYRIEAGDTLYQLAENCRCAVRRIIKHNRSLDPRQLIIGKLILIPPQKK